MKMKKIGRALQGMGGPPQSKKQKATKTKPNKLKKFGQVLKGAFER